MSIDATPAPAGDYRGVAVELVVPADSAFLLVVRTTTAAVAARMDFTVDEIEDLRIAVYEACAMLLSDSSQAQQLACRFALDGDELAVTVQSSGPSGHPPSTDSFAWTVLTALVGTVDTETGPDGRVRLTLRKRRGADQPWVS